MPHSLHRSGLSTVTVDVLDNYAALFRIDKAEIREETFSDCVRGVYVDRFRFNSPH